MTRRSAFTLIEVLAALAVLVAVVAALGTLTWDLAERRARLSAAADTAIGIDAAVDRLAGALLTCVAGDERVGAGIRGDGANLSVLSRTTWIDVNRSTGALDLAETALHFNGDSCWMEYRLVGEEPDASEVIDGIRQVRFRYVADGRWVDEFDSVAAGGLPDAVEVSVWFGSAMGEIEGEVPPDRTMLIAVPDGGGAQSP